MKAELNQTGDWLKELREDRGLSPEEVPHEMLKAHIERRVIPSGRTIRRAEFGQVPQVRYRLGIAQFYGVDLHTLWPVSDRRRVAR